MAKDAFLTELSGSQKEAVLCSNQPLLVLAGAGSGKTKMMMYKYAYLVSKKNVPSSDILALTFTKKAAREMQESIAQLVPGGLDRSNIGTFHAECTKILRNEIDGIGYRNDFVIYDEQDTCVLIKHILRELKIYEALYKGVASRISALKAQMITPDMFVASGDSFGFDEKLARVYMRYQYELKRSNALDVDDLVMVAVQLFDAKPGVLAKYRKAYKYVLIDEFQEINRAQYAFVKLLAPPKGGLCAFGDDDQSIYKFRGADVRTMLQMKSDFPSLKIVSIGNNYRSTPNIVQVSHSIISKVPNRKEKQIRPERSGGEKVFQYWFGTEVEEAKYIAKLIREMFLKGKYSYKDIAILYRVSMQARALEDALNAERIPYAVVGGQSFYQKKEIKDVMAYMRLCVNPHDSVSLRRVINYPPRGIGSATLNKIEGEAKKRDRSLYDTIRDICAAKSISASVKEKLSGFISFIEGIGKDKYASAAGMLRKILDGAGYVDTLDDESVQNLFELVREAEDASVEEFLDRIALHTNLDDAAASSAVSLMTLQTAKGYEFPVVFLTGMEEGILPHYKAVEDPEEMQEERRLLYVGITRARDLLYLSGASKRRLYSKIQAQEQSRFIKEIPVSCCKTSEKCKKAKADIGAVLPRIKKIALIPQYKTGCRVRHPKWGVGVVRDCYGDGEDLKVMVNFPDVGIKRLALKFAQLEKI